MRTTVQFMVVAVIGLGSSTAAVAREALLSDDSIRTRMIHDSVAAYSGNCPCPYSTKRNGRRCGGNSAYSRPGGQSPLCYPQDITPAMIDRYRKSHSPPAAR